MKKSGENNSQAYTSSLDHSAAPKRIAFPGLEDHVLCASVSWDAEKDGGNRKDRAKAKVITLLLGYLESPVKDLWSSGESCNLSFQGAFRITNDPMGRPLLICGPLCGLSISFSHLLRSTWGALSGGGYGLGLDAATPMDFGEGYPYSKVFHQDEFDLFCRQFETREKGAAALWAAKEAVVKALGCGFRLISPLDLEVTSRTGSVPDHRFVARIANLAIQKIPGISVEAVPLHIVEEEGIYLAVSVLGVKRN